MKGIRGIHLAVLVAGLTTGVTQAAHNTTDEADFPVSATLLIKTAGNPAQEVPHQWQAESGTDWRLVSQAFDDASVLLHKEGETMAVTIEASADVNINLQLHIPTAYDFSESDLFLPGFWYKKNLKVSEGAPSADVSHHWSFREDRLSIPLTSVFSPADGQGMLVMRTNEHQQDAVSLPGKGEMILSGQSDIGSAGFADIGGKVALQVGFPFLEAPYTYTKKLHLAPLSQAFLPMKKGQTVTLNYKISTVDAGDFSSFVADVWEQAYDEFQPQPVNNPLPTEQVKSILSQFYQQSFTDDYELAGFSGQNITVENAEIRPNFEVGFIGRVLLNAFNAIEYGRAHNEPTLVAKGEAVIRSYTDKGFNSGGFLREVVNFEKGRETPDYSIRRQSEGLYALFLYLQYENQRGKSHPQLETKIRRLLSNMLTLQKDNGSFPRKFDINMRVVDEAEGSSASAVLALTFAHRYFGDDIYLKAARRTGDYLVNVTVKNAEYYSSTLDANCIDKEAALFTGMALYYLSMLTDDEQQYQRYVDAAAKANYFVMSWFYLWDVPFAPGQMLGDIGLQTRGWGNVSAENNHIDAYIFGYLNVMRWVAEEKQDKRAANMADVIQTSLTSQLLPRPGHMAGMAKVGYHPEVVQHTNWQYHHNGKGFYNDDFAPGWVVASVWEMLSEDRAKQFLQAKR